MGGPLTEFLRDKVKPLFDLKGFLLQSRKILADPAGTAIPNETAALSPLKYALFGCMLFLWITMAVEFLFMNFLPLSYSSAVEESAKTTALLRSVYATELPLTFLLGSYVFKYGMRHKGSPSVAEHAHAYHLQYVFLLALLPNLLAALVFHTVVLEQYYVAPDWLELLAVVGYLLLGPVALVSTVITTRTTSRIFHEAWPGVLVALTLSNAVGYLASRLILALPGYLAEVISRSLARA